ncbi:MAG: DNA recombination protein RmuC [Bacteroidaceae bacterium]|nr:DNA recombination protein RmuC [Bacteroidaceae bacterium]MBR6600233.1 DNA recombination protein RmuC [Bacteroidaceae bacterium]
MEIYLVIVSLVLLSVLGIVALVLLVKVNRRRQALGEEQLRQLLTEQTAELLGQLQTVREELSRITREQMAENRMELGRRVEDLRKEIADNQVLQLQQILDTLNRNLLTTNELQRDKLETMTRRQEQLVQSTEKRLDEMRLMVEEKLQKTLNERIGQSFELVRTQLENVQKGLGEMKSLAQDVGGLKRVLTNVKTRGTFGEVQLQALLEQMLSPEQYDANVKTKQKSTEFVEFAVKLPGKEDGLECVYLPIDAKFPKDAYEQYLDAYESGEVERINATSHQLEIVVKKMARDIRDKYLDPPYTTDFGIMFLPFENIYAEVIRRTALVELLQREFRVIVTGPTTLGAILNSLQMGFRTLAIEKRSSEVWTVLAAVKTEFGKFGGMLMKVQKNLETAGTQLDEVIGKRTRAIERKLRQVQELPADQSADILSLDSAVLDEEQE